MKNKITELPDGQFSGYYWRSNETHPQPIKGQFDKDLLSKGVPFIVEAVMFDKQSNISISIHHNGVEHQMFQYDLNKKDGYVFTEIDIEVQKLPGIKSAKFIQVWKETPDSLCADMLTLKPFAQVFAGFN